MPPTAHQLSNHLNWWAMMITQLPDFDRSNACLQADEETGEEACLAWLTKCQTVFSSPPGAVDCCAGDHVILDTGSAAVGVTVCLPPMHTSGHIVLRLLAGYC